MAEFNGQTLDRYSPVAMKIKVGGGGDPYRGRARFPPRGNGEKIARDAALLAVLSRLFHVSFRRRFANFFNVSRKIVLLRRTRASRSSRMLR